MPRRKKVLTIGFHERGTFERGLSIDGIRDYSSPTSRDQVSNFLTSGEGSRTMGGNTPLRGYPRSVRPANSELHTFLELSFPKTLEAKAGG